MYIAAVFLILYCLVWIRYFTGGRKVSLFKKAFLFVPMPLAVFLTFYYLCGAIRLRFAPADCKQHRRILCDELSPHSTLTVLCSFHPLRIWKS